MREMGFCVVAGRDVRCGRLVHSVCDIGRKRVWRSRVVRATLDVAGVKDVQDDDVVTDKVMYVVRRADPGCELFTAADLRSRCFRQEDGDHAGFYQYRRTVLEWMHNSLQQEDSYCFIAAEAAAPEERRVIGTLDATVHTALVNETMPRAIYVSSIAVRPDRRRLGVATAMLREVDQIALQLNITSIFLHVEPWNVPAIKLYRNAGYHCYQGELCKWLRELSKAENTLLYKNLAWTRN